MIQNVNIDTDVGWILSFFYSTMCHTFFIKCKSILHQRAVVKTTDGTIDNISTK